MVYCQVRHRQESAFVPELYFYMLAEALTYLDKGLGLSGCPVDGMDKHQGGMFEILGPVSKETLADNSETFLSVVPQEPLKRNEHTHNSLSL